MPCRGACRFILQPGPQDGFGLVEFADRRVGGREQPPRIRVAGLQLHGLVMAGDRLLEAALSRQDAPEIVIGLPVRRVCRDRRPVGAFGLGQAPERAERDAAIVQRVRMGGLQPDRGVVGVDRLGQTMALGQDVAEIVVHAGIVRLQADRAPDQRDRLVGPPCVVMKQAVEMEGRRVVRLRRQDAPVHVLRHPDVSGAMRPHRDLQRLLDGDDLLVPVRPGPGTMRHGDLRGGSRPPLASHIIDLSVGGAPRGL